MYSRTNLPLDQFSSTSRSTNGSLIGVREVTLMKCRPPRSSTTICRPARELLYCSPAARNCIRRGESGRKRCGLVATDGSYFDFGLQRLTKGRLDRQASESGGLREAAPTDKRQADGNGQGRTSRPCRDLGGVWLVKCRGRHVSTSAGVSTFDCNIRHLDGSRRGDRRQCHRQRCATLCVAVRPHPRATGRPR